MSIPASPKLSIDKNRYYALTLPFSVNGAALDVSSWTFAGQVAPEAGGTSTDMTVDTSSAASGTIIMHLTSTQTNALPDVVTVGVDVTISGNKVQILRTTARVSTPVEP